MIIGDLQYALQQWLDRQPYVYKLSGFSYGLKLQEESGEVAKLLNRRLEGRYPGNPASFRRDLALELADVVNCACQLASQEGIDMDAAVRQRLDKLRHREAETGT